MPRRLPRVKRLLKLGALGGLLIGVAKFVKRRRGRPVTSESSWPTLADTAAESGRPVDDSASADSGASDDETDGAGTPAAEDAAADGEDGQGDSDAADDAVGAEAEMAPSSD